MKLVIFDLDGTVLDTLEDLADSMNHVLRERGLPEHSLEAIRSFVGNGIRNLVERSVPGGLPGEQVDEVYRAFLTWYSAHCAEKTRPYPGIEGLLADLQEWGVLTAIHSNKADPVTRRLVQRFFGEKIGCCLGALEDVPKKPAPDGVKRILFRCGVEEKDTVYVGDSEVDARTAQNAGVKAVLVTWGFRDRSVLEAAAWKDAQFADSAAQLQEILWKSTVAHTEEPL